MIHASKIERILNDRRDPKLVAAVMECEQLGLRKIMGRSEFFRHVSIDAASGSKSKSSSSYGQKTK